MPGYRTKRFSRKRRVFKKRSRRFRRSGRRGRVSVRSPYIRSTFYKARPAKLVSRRQDLNFVKQNFMSNLAGAFVFKNVPGAIIMDPATNLIPSNQADSNGYGFQLLTTIPTGTGISTRLGNMIRIKKIAFRGIVRNTTPSTTIECPSTLTLMLVLDHSPQNTQVQYTEIFDTCTSGNPLPLDTRNVNYLARFRVLKRVHIRLGQSKIGSQIKMNWRGDIPVRYANNDTTGTYSNVSWNCVHLWAWIDYMPSGSAAWSAIGYVKTSFIP